MAFGKEEVMAYHKGGKVAVKLPRELKTKEDLCLAYTPGVAHAVKAIAANPEDIYACTAKPNLVAVVSDGTAILGLGDLGAAASIPVMEGKAVLFKAFGDVDAWPVPLNHCRKDGANTGKTDPKRVIEAVKMLAPQYGGVNLEDIASPACFEIEDTLDAELDIPVFHDDQWGTAVISLSGVMNYAKLAGKELKDLKVVMNGAGAAGIRICDMLKAAGVVDVTMCDTKGTIRTDRTDLNPFKAKHARDTKALTLKEALVGADVFIGVSAANVLTGDDVKTMAEFPAIFAMANPDPEIAPAEVQKALAGRKYVMVTGRSDYPNQINNVLGFPYLFRGALDVRATTINKEMKVAAAHALAALAQQPVTPEVAALYPDEKLEFGTGYIIPKAFDRRLFVEVSYAVAEAAVKTGVAKCPPADLAAYKAELVRRNEERM
ncbi:MAG: malic enzyme-like NAD(P)-binding protein [Kiritimatiellia bacterium]|nr:malic enzyme-like NAD(P)-binding protein [Kiritimatiellia bacterium]